MLGSGEPYKFEPPVLEEESYSLKLGSLFVSPCPPECNFQSGTKIEPDLGLDCGRLLKMVI